MGIHLAISTLAPVYPLEMGTVRDFKWTLIKFNLLYSTETAMLEPFIFEMERNIILWITTMYCVQVIHTDSKRELTLHICPT